MWRRGKNLRPTDILGTQKTCHGTPRHVTYDILSVSKECFTSQIILSRECLVYHRLQSELEATDAETG